MTTYNLKLEDNLGRIIRPIVGNTVKDGSGTWYFLTVDSNGKLKVDAVKGPSSSVDNSIARFNGTTGKLIQGYTSDAPTISDTGLMTLRANLQLGANKILFGGNAALSLFSADVLQITDESGSTTYDDLLLDTLHVAGTIISTANGVSLMPNYAINDWYYGFRAGLNDQTNHVRIGWLQSAAQPYFGIGRDDTTVTTNAIIDGLRLRMACGTNNSAAGQGFGLPIFLGNDASELEERARIDFYLLDASDGAETTAIALRVKSGASTVTPLLITPTGIVVTPDLPATNVGAAELGSATFDDVQDYINFFGDRTLITGGTITDNGDGEATVAAGTAWCKSTDSDTAIGVFFDFSEDATVSLTNLTTNYVYVDYNGGSPQIVVATDTTTYGFQQDHVFVGTIYRDGTVLHFHQADNLGIGRMGRVHMHHVEETPAHRASGMVTSSVGTRNLGVTAGRLYEGLSPHSTSPFTTPNSGTADATEANKLHDDDGGFADTDVGKRVKNTTDTTYAFVTAFVDSGELTLDADIFVNGENYDLDTWSYWYYDGDLGPAAWVEVLGVAAISNTQYNALATGLASLTANRYGVHWVYMDIDGNHLHVVYGQGNYKANEAEEAGVPASLPDIVVNYCILIAKIICQQGTDTLLIMYPWTSAFTSSLATDHNSLANLTVGNAHPQYRLVAENVGAIGLIIDGGGSAITTGIKGDIPVPYGCTITAVTMTAYPSGSIVVDIWKQAYADFPPEDANSITASAVPTITTAEKSQDSTLSGWTTAISANDILRFNVDSISTVERCTILLTVTKT